MKICCKILLFISLILAMFALNGCPHHIANELDEQFRYRKPPENYVPSYRTEPNKYLTASEIEKRIAKAAEADSLIQSTFDTSEVDIEDLPIIQTDVNITDSTSYISIGLNIPGRNKTAQPLDPPKNQKKEAISFKITGLNSNDYPDKIELKAIVSDSRGQNISGLAPPYYEGKDNYKKYWPVLFDSCRGKRYSPKFEITEIREKQAPSYAISFVLDHSPSMSDYKAKKLQEAVQKILYAIKPNDYVNVIKFSREIHNEIPLTNNRNEFRGKVVCDGLAERKYGDGTAMYDAVLAATEELKNAPDGYKKIIILFSDGGDNSSKSSVDTVQYVVNNANASVYSIAYGHADTTLPHLSELTGGYFYQIYYHQEFPFVFRDIYMSLNNYYKITYTPPDCAGKHFVLTGIQLAGLLSFDRASYDKSLFKKYDPIGSMVFANIEFDFGKATVKKESMPIIKNIASALKENPGIRLQINGHTDNIGSAENNMELSINRAKAVKEKLVSLGINQDRLEIKGFGETQPLVENNTEENRKANRRTEFVVISK